MHSDGVQCLDGSPSLLQFGVLHEVLHEGFAEPLIGKGECSEQAALIRFSYLLILRRIGLIGA